MTDTKRIAPDVILGKDVKLFAFVNLYGCEIGDDTKIGTFVEIQKGAKALILVKLAHDLSGDMDADAIQTTYDLFLRDAREKMGLTPSD